MSSDAPSTRRETEGPAEPELHPVLTRLLRKEGLSARQSLPPLESWRALLIRLSNVLIQADQDRYTQEHALEVVSEEMRALYDELRSASDSQLARERDLLRAVMGSVGDGLCVLDASGTLIFANAEAERLLGATSGELAGRGGRDFCGALAPALFSAEFMSGESRRGEDALLSRIDGSVFAAGYVVTPVVRDQTVVAIVTVFRDITEQKRSAAQLRAAHDQAVEIARLKSEFVANISHELRTPLNGVIGMSELLALTPLDSRQQRYAETIRTCSDSLLSLINGILDFSALEASRLDVRREPFRPRDSVAGILTIVGKAARANAVRLEAEIDPAVPAEVEGDRGRVSQVLLNLVTNAVKFTTQGAVSIRATVSAADDDRIWLRFEVADTGIGLAPEHREIIFEPFRQVDGSSARRSGGSGLGLSLCRSLVERMGGQIGLDSALGRGSTFWFSVPVKALPQPAAVTDLNGTRVLVAEDNEINRELIVEILTLAGVDVSVARDGREATDLCATTDFDLVLMDCLMPELDGFAAARIIRGRTGSNPPIVAFTASSGPDVRGHCLDAGMDDVLSKPASPSEILATVRKWALSSRA